METVCTQLFNVLGLNQDPGFIQEENFSIEHQGIFLKGELEGFVNQYYPYRELILSYLDVFLRRSDQPSFYNTNQILIDHFKKKPLVAALKEILSPVGTIPELMNIVSLCLLFNFTRIRRIKHNDKNPPRIVIDGPLSNWKLYMGRKKQLGLQKASFGILSISMVKEPGHEKAFSTETKIIRFSGSSLQRILALQLIKNRKQEKTTIQEIAIFKAWWFRDGNSNKKGWYKLLRKLKPVHLIQSQKFKEERLKRRRFIKKMMHSLKGSFKERLEQTREEANKRFMGNKPYSISTIKREYMRALKERQ